MSRFFLSIVCGVMCWASALPAFEVQATLKQVDRDKGFLIVHAGQMDRTLRVPPEVKVFDGQGKELTDGLKAKELKEGTPLTLVVERIDDKPVLRAIRLGTKTDAPVPAKDGVKVDTSGLRPLTDLGLEEYHGFPGGLYPNGKNERPSQHEAVGDSLARQVQPLDGEGKPSADGKIVLLAIGFSNTVQSFSGFMQVARDDKELNPKVVLVNGAVGGMSANMIQNPEDNGRGTLYWKTVDERLKAAGVTRAQVQVVWIKETNPAPHDGGFPRYIQALQAELTRIVQILPQRFPHLKLAYLSSRTFGGWAKAAPGRAAPGNSEPFSCETGFAVKWLIEQQLKGDPALNFDSARGEVKAPWLSWGPYLWANGEKKRKDGFSFQLDDFRENDRMHHSPQGQEKIGKQLLHFFKTDSTTRGWFVNKAN